MLRLVRVGLDLLANRGDVPVDRSRDDLLVDAPHVAKQLPSGHRPAAVLDQIAQNVELERRKAHLFLAANGLVGGEVDLHVPDLVDAHGGPIWRLRALQDGADACCQLFGIKRLRNVVFSAESESPEDILLLALGGEHEHGRRDAQLLTFLEHVEAVLFGQHDVQQYDVVVPFLDVLHGLLAVLGERDVIPLQVEEVLKADADVLVVFDDQHLESLFRRFHAVALHPVSSR